MVLLRSSIAASFGTESSLAPFSEDSPGFRNEISLTNAARLGCAITRTDAVTSDAGLIASAAFFIGGTHARCPGRVRRVPMDESRKTAQFRLAPVRACRS